MGKLGGLEVLATDKRMHVDIGSSLLPCYKCEFTSFVFFFFPFLLSEQAPVVSNGELASTFSLCFQGIRLIEWEVVPSLLLLMDVRRMLNSENVEMVRKIAAGLQRKHKHFSIICL